jgi:hypothetical protein
MGAERQRALSRHQQALPTPNTPTQAAKATVKQTTLDNLSGETSEVAQRGPARRPRKGVQAGTTQGRIALAHGNEVTSAPEH